MKEVSDRYYTSLAKALMGGQPVDQRSIDLNRGIVTGMQHLVKFPSKAKTVVDRVLSEERKPVE